MPGRERTMGDKLLFPPIHMRECLVGTYQREKWLQINSTATVHSLPFLMYVCIRERKSQRFIFLSHDLIEYIEIFTSFKFKFVHLVHGMKLLYKQGYFVFCMSIHCPITNKYVFKTKKCFFVYYKAAPLASICSSNGRKNREQPKAITGPM